MKKESVNNSISAEVLAAYLDGNATPQESRQILDSLSHDSELREILEISQSVDAELGIMPQEVDIIPMSALAATCNENNYCCLECEKYILKKFGIQFNEQELLNNAIKCGWQKKRGTALHNVGRHLESHGLTVSRKYNSSLEDIIKALEADKSIIAAVDGGELLGDRKKEIREDILIGRIPDHTVVILSYDADNRTITIYDPNSINAQDTYPIARFEDAWDDSKKYIVTINHKEMNNYIPNPIDLSDVKLTEDLNELREAIAENAHEIWAKNRQDEGWSYGEKRDDEKRLHPDMLPYSQLPEGEKEYDRKMAIETIKLVKKLGYDIIKREETELYQVLKQRIKNSRTQYYCPQCKRVVYKHQIFCDNCGHKLDIDWNEK